MDGGDGLAVRDAGVAGRERITSRRVTRVGNPTAVLNRRWLAIFLFFFFFFFSMTFDGCSFLHSDFAIVVRQHLHLGDMKIELSNYGAYCWDLPAIVSPH